MNDNLEGHLKYKVLMKNGEEHNLFFPGESNREVMEWMNKKTKEDKWLMVGDDQIVDINDVKKLIMVKKSGVKNDNTKK